MSNAAYRYDGANWIRIRNTRHLDTTFKRVKGAYYASLIGYQQWEGLPDSPFLTADYPYQCIWKYGSYFVSMCETRLYRVQSETDPDDYTIGGTGDGYVYRYSGGSWIWVQNGEGFKETNDGVVIRPIQQANADIYHGGTTNIYFAQTTPENNTEFTKRVIL